MPRMGRPRLHDRHLPPRMRRKGKCYYYRARDGRELPLIKLETTSESHPFYTGTQKSVDSLGGRVEKFRTKFAHLKK